MTTAIQIQNGLPLNLSNNNLVCFEQEIEVFVLTLNVISCLLLSAYQLCSSVSIPFVASQLRTNEPFIAAYEVYADIVQPEMIKHLEKCNY